MSDILLFLKIIYSKFINSCVFEVQLYILGYLQIIDEVSNGENFISDSAAQEFVISLLKETNILIKI